MVANDTQFLEAAPLISTFLEAIETELGLPITRSLFVIAQTPGLSINDLAERLAVPQQTASRYVAILQGRYQSSISTGSLPLQKPLVSLQVSHLDPRRRALFLTPEGKKRVGRLVNLYLGAR